LALLVRRRTVANVDSMAFVLRRWTQCAAEYAKWASKASRSLSSLSVAFGYLAPDQVLQAAGDESTALRPLVGAAAARRRPV
jgi:hypothetical protein